MSRIKRKFPYLVVALLVVCVTLALTTIYVWKGKMSLVRADTHGSINYPSIRDQVDAYLKEKGVQHSFFFQYLPSTISIKLDEDQVGRAASLLKLPIAMSLLRLSEEGKVDLNKTITLQQPWLDSRFGNLYKKGAGFKLTLRDAARDMIAESDNTALHAVQANMPPQADLSSSEDTNNYLDIPITDENAVTSERYAEYMRCLYYSCFLTKDDSEQVLTWMSEEHFPGIRDGVPRNVIVADKIGSSPQTQSDCGIVYVPGKNYILCVLLNSTQSDLSQIIAHVSSIVYHGVVQDPLQAQ